MPIIAQAIKKMRHDKKRALLNKKARKNLRDAIKLARAKTDKKSISSAFSALDKANKMGIIHKNKASRIKSRIAKKSS